MERVLTRNVDKENSTSIAVYEAVQAGRDPTWDDTELVVDLDFESLTAEQQTRIREIDVAEDQRLPHDRVRPQVLRVVLLGGRVGALHLARRPGASKALCSPAIL